MSRRKKAYIALFLNALLWGIAPPLVKLALPYTTPFRWLFYRYIIAVICITPLLVIYLRRYKPNLKTLFTIIGLEFLGTTIVLTLLYEGLKISSAIDASLITALAPLFVIGGSIVFLHERQTRREWRGLGLALFGTLLIILEPLIIHGTLSNGSSVLGNILFFLHNVVWMLYVLAAKRLYRKLPKFMIAMISFWVGLVSFGLLALMTTPASFLFADLSNPLVATTALYMAIPGSIIALTLYLYGQNLIEVSEAVVFSYLQPLIAIPFAVVWLQEEITPITIIAGVLIAIGVWLAESRGRRV